MMDGQQFAAFSSDESACSASTRPTTPEWSPLIPPQQEYRRQSSFNLADDTVNLPSPNLEPAAITETVDVIRDVCVIGAGYVGGPTAAVLALHNPDIKVTVLDRDAARIESWKSVHLPIHEPGLYPIVAIARDGGIDVKNQDIKRKANLFFSTDSVASISNADLIFLAVNTPTKSSGRGAGAASDLSALESATSDIAKYAKNGTIIVEKSTVPCGTARLIARIMNATRPQESFPILSNPEFLAEGSAIRNLQKPDRVLLGCMPSVAGRLASRKLAALYAAWVPHERILYTNVWSSELAKLVANATLAQRISSINSISALCERTGADIREITKAVGSDNRIGSKFLKAGLGFGGSCFRKDISSLVYIAESFDLPQVADYWRAVLAMNVYQRQRFADKIISRLNNTLNRKKVTLLGFAYKKDTGDTRESLAVDVISSLLEENPLEIAVFDPCCTKENIEQELAHLPGAFNRVKIYSDPYSACQNACAIAIMTEWDLFKADRQLPVLRKQMPITNSEAGKQTHYQTSAEELDVLRRYTPASQPTCPSSCQTCSQNSTKAAAVVSIGERLDWLRIAKTLVEPKYILDGRGILDEKAMKGFDLEVEGLGWGNMASSSTAF